MDLSVVDIQALRLAAERRSFRAAANELDVTPQAVSKRIQQLEALAGVRLFHRSSTGVELTAEGAQLNAAARRVVFELAHFERVLARLAGGREEVAISVSPTVFEPFLIPGLRAFERRTGEGLDDLNTAIRMSNSDGVRRDVAQHRAAFGIAARAPVRSGGDRTAALQERLLYVDEIVVAVDPTHRWARRDEKKKPLRLKEVARTRMATRDAGSNVRHVFEAALGERGLELAEPASEVGAARLVIDAALKKRCPALLSRLALRDHGELQIVPVYEDVAEGQRKVEVTREFVITYLDWDLLSVDIRRLIEFLVDWVQHDFPVGGAA